MQNIYGMFALISVLIGSKLSVSKSILTLQISFVKLDKTYHLFLSFDVVITTAASFIHHSYALVEYHIYLSFEVFITTAVSFFHHSRALLEHNILK